MSAGSARTQRQGLTAFLLFSFIIWSTDLDYEMQNLRDSLNAGTKYEYLSGTTETFDFVIIGAGSAGSVVANRLSKPFTVLVLEEGAGRPPPLNFVPFVSPAFRSTKIERMYRTVPQVNAALEDPEKRIRIYAGRGAGGTAALNSMMYVRGNPKDYDAWADLTGNPIWAYKSVLQFFKLFEDYGGPHPNAHYHGQGGKIHVEDSTYEPALKSDFFSAVRENGIRTGDLSANNGTIFSSPDVTIWNGERENSYTNYLKPALGSHLKLYPFSKVIKIHISKNMVATGVTYLRHGTKHTVRARKEVIVAAGPINSPRVLMYSGIGPKSLLEKFGINCLVDLPVGKNLQDHPNTRFVILLNDTVSNIPARDLSLADVSAYFPNRKGVLATPPESRLALGFYSSPNNRDPTWPDIYYIVYGQGIACDEDLARLYEIGICDRSKPQKYVDGIEVDVLFVRPTSPPGDVRISSGTYNDDPLIDPKYFGNQTDVERLIDGSLFFLDLIESSTAFKKYNARLAPWPIPGCERHKFRSHAYWDCYVRHTTSESGYHLAGSNRMGRAGDPRSVLDPELRVLHIRRLRVIDSSIMPTIVSGNTFIPTLMIAEVGSHLILKQWKKRV